MTRTKNKKPKMQPPLPRGPPPRLSAPAEQYGGDSYRPGSSYNNATPPMYSFRGAASRADDMHRSAGREIQMGAGQAYRPQYDAPSDHRQPSRGYDSYAPHDQGRDGRDMSNTYRPAYGPPGVGPSESSYRSSYDDGFNFRFEAPPGLDHRQADTYRAQTSRPRDAANEPRRYERRTNNQQRGGRGGYRGRYAPQMASDRDFLKTNRAPTPELMPGMDEDHGVSVKYKAVEDMSDSDEAEMDLSNSDDETDAPKKKQARTIMTTADGDNVPRFAEGAPQWSNPDPYTVLPPPDETQRKKKDVLKLIRKARVTDSSDHTSKPAAVLDDFISFDFDDEDEQQPGKGVEGAPTGPRSNLHDVTTQDTRPASPPYKHFTPTSDQQVARPYSGRDDRTFSSEHRISTGQAYASNTRSSNALLPAPKHPDKPFPQGQMNQATNDGQQQQSSASVQPFQVTAPMKKLIPVDLTSDPALGSRKRTVRDEIKPLQPPPQIHEKVKKGTPNGAIVNSWQALHDGSRTPWQNRSSTPWVTVDHSRTALMGVWLHKEIMDFYHFVKPREFEQVIRTRLVEDLRSKIKQAYPNTDIRAFGSFPAGLYLPTADMDLVCVSNQFLSTGMNALVDKTSFYFKFAAALKRLKLPLNDEVEVVAKAKVPLVKYVDRITGLKVDISFENDTGLIANKTFQEWKTTFPAMPILVTLIKHFLAMRGLNEPFNGGIGGFTTICLVVSLLQLKPEVQSGTMIPEHHLGELLMEFFDLYGNEFDTVTTAIIMKPPSYAPKHRLNIPYKQNSKPKFMVIDPNRSSNDITGGAMNTPVILKEFSYAYKDLSNQMADLSHSEDREFASILSCILGGNYSSFKLQREHLAHVYENLYGPLEEQI